MGKVQSLAGSRLLYNDLRKRIASSDYILTISIGTVTTGAPGTKARAEVVGESPDFKLNLTIPQGIAGEDATIEIGKTETGDPYTEAKVENVGTDTHAILNFTIPRGKDGSEGEPTFIYEQSVASDTWVINHNLSKMPSVTVVDTSGNVVIGDVEYLDVNNIKVHFNYQFKGSAYLN